MGIAKAWGVAALLIATACGQAESPTADEAGPNEQPTSAPATEPSEPAVTTEMTSPEPEMTSSEPEMEEPEAAETERPASPAPSPPGTRIKTAGSQFGTMLFDGTGQAIYLFDREQTSRSQCYGQCAAEWPPVLTKGDPRAVGGVRSRLLGTTERRDGRLQVTYGGHPLYYYAHEDKNQVLCHDVPGFGGLWLVVTPSGDAAPA